MNASSEMTMSPAKTSVRGFGGWGWAMILYSVVMYFSYAGWSADGLNIFVPALGKAHGWDAATLLSLVTPGGLFGVVGSAVFGQVIIKRGARFVFVFCLVCMAFTVFWFGRMSSLWEFTVTFILINFFGVGFGFIATGTLMTTWFPRKKGIALGIATMGFPLATAVFVPLIAFMFGQMGIPAATLVWSVVLLIVAVVGFFLIRDNPEQIGCYPDNEPISAAEIKANLDELTNYVSTFTVKKLLRDKEMWLISIGWGALWLVTTGIVVQMVPRMTSIGYSLSHAIALLSIAAICAVPGSILWGWLDQKFGPKLASVVYALLYIATLLLLIFQTGNTVITFFTVVCVGLGLGGIKNLITSIIGTVYGRYDFTAANRMIMPISIIVRTLAFVVMGATLAAFKTLSAAYAAFIVVDIIAIFLIIATNASCKGKSL